MKSDLILWVVEGSEERQPLDVVHVGVSKENVGIKTITFLMHDFLAEGSNTGACINYNTAGTTSDLKAGCVAAIFNGIRAWTSNATSGSPELETKGSVVRHKFLIPLRSVECFLIVGKNFLRGEFFSRNPAEGR
jgi:hypothetical protein